MFYFVYLALLLMLRTINSEPVEEAFVNQPLERLAGVYFENLADLHIFRDEWKFINYVNLAPLEEKEKILTFYVEKIDLLCHSNPVTHIA